MKIAEYGSNAQSDDDRLTRDQWIARPNLKAGRWILREHAARPNRIAAVVEVDGDTMRVHAFGEQQDLLPDVLPPARIFARDADRRQALRGLSDPLDEWLDR